MSSKKILSLIVTAALAFQSMPFAVAATNPNNNSNSGQASGGFGGFGGGFGGGNGGSFGGGSGNGGGQRRGGGMMKKLQTEIEAAFKGKKVDPNSSDFKNKVDNIYKTKFSEYADRFPEEMFLNLAKNIYQSILTGKPMTFTRKPGQAGQNGSGKNSASGKTVKNPKTTAKTGTTAKSTSKTTVAKASASKSTASKTSASKAKTVVKATPAIKVSSKSNVISVNVPSSKVTSAPQYASAAIKRMISLGIISSSTNVNAALTRQQFVQMMIIASGNGDLVKETKATSTFSDISNSSSLVPYISIAVKKGYISGLADGKFHPNDPVTYGQVCTAMVRALNYTDKDVTGIWPKNYTDMAASLGITNNLSFSGNQSIGVWAAAYMFSNLMDTYMNKTNQNAQDKTFIDASGLSRDSYAYGLILNPIYSKPQLVTNYKAGASKVGSISLSGKKIIKNGQVAKNSDIKDYDVVYNVTDKWGKKSYILVVEDKVTGTIGSISPDKINPTSIQLDNKSYPVSSNLNMSKVKNGTIKEGNPITAFLGYDGKIVDALYGKYTQCIVLGNSTTDSDLNANQVLTDKGVYTVSGSKKLMLGYEYNVSMDASKITNVFDSVNYIKNVSVDSVLDSSVNTYVNGKKVQVNLPDKITYYYNGQKQNYNNLTSVINPYSTVIFGYNANKTDYDYGIILDPVYSKPILNGDTKKLAGKIIKDGEVISPSQITKTDVVYNISSIGGGKGQAQVIDKMVNGTLNAILPSKLAPKQIQLDNKNYEISKDMNLSVLKADNTMIKVGNNVTALLGYDGKVVNILYGQYQQNIIIANSTTDSALDANEILTDKGVYQVSSSMKFEVGYKYLLAVSNAKVIADYGKINSLKKVTVDNVVDSNVTTSVNGKSSTVALPSNITYYYNNQKLNYNNVINSLQPFSTIIFANNQNSTGYEYAVILDPVFKQTAVSSNNTGAALKNIDLKKSKIIKDGEVISPDKIKSTDLIYSVTDTSGKNSYILVVDKMVNGVLTGVLPNTLAPKQIQIDNKNYDISSEMNVSKLKAANGNLKIGNNVTALLGYNGKVVDCLYGQYQQAIVLGTSDTNSQLDTNEILTDKGIYQVPANQKYEVGYKYLLTVSDSKVNSDFGKANTVKTVIVDSIIDSNVYTKVQNKSQKVSLPDKITYYYNNQKLSYSNVINILQPYSSIIFANNANGTGYDYAVISDPSYNKSANSGMGSKLSLNDLKAMGNVKIIKDGQVITADKINSTDIIYKVTDNTGKNSYFLVLDKMVSGTLTSLTPNSQTPKQIQIDNKSYDLGKDMDITKISSANSMLKIGNSVTAIMGYDGKVVDMLYGQYQQCIVLGDSSTNSSLDSNQILTDKGIYQLPQGVKLQVGGKYNLTVANSGIINVYNKINQVNDVLIDSVVDSTVFEDNNGSTKAITLPDYITYYYNGQKVQFANVVSDIKPLSTITFANNTNNTGYEYAVITDPVYSSPEIASGTGNISNKIGSIDLTNKTIIKNGDVITKDKISPNDVVYSVTDKNKKKSCIVVMDNKISGVLSGIAPNELSPKSIQIDNKDYQISKYLKVSKLISNENPLEINDYVTAITGVDGKVLDVLYGQYVESVVLADSRTNSKLGTNQVLTDKGIYTMPDKTALSLGYKYDFAVSGNKIIKVYNQTNTADEYIVNTVNGSSIEAEINGQKTNLSLPDKVTYYYNGTKQTYDNLPSLLKLYSTIVFAYNNQKTDYEYAVIYDPVYSKAQVVSNITSGTKAIGSIDISNSQIVKDGDLISGNQINNNDVLYNVSDIKNKKHYVLDVDNSISGTITGILPDRISPTVIQVDSKNYQISNDMLAGTLNSSGSPAALNQDATVLLGYDGKAVGVVSGRYMDLIVLGNKQSNSNLAANQVLTDKGIYTMPDGTSLDIGYKYKVGLTGTKVSKIYAKENAADDVVVDTIANSAVCTLVNGQDQQVNLSDRITYYYNGAKVNYSDLLNTIKPYALITFAYNNQRTDYEYAVITDPVYSAPQLISSYGIVQNVIDTSVPIVRNGVTTNINQEGYGDAVYSVSTIRGQKTHTVIINDVVSGNITAIGPDLNAPKNVTINNVVYNFSDSINMANSYTKLKRNAYVTLILGYDGKVIDIW